jgi:anti-sigma factor ChrR (cupin superfamily)
MSTAPGEHEREHLEALSLYAVGALSASEAAIVEARIAACLECRQEIEALGQVVGSFPAWPADVVRPPASLRGRLAQRIATDTGGEPLLTPPPDASEQEWANVAPGIACQLLAADPDRSSVSMLVRLAPGADYPPHRHAGVEELYLLDGELMVDDKKLYPGDYLRSEPGTMDRRVWSETGCTCLLMTSTQDELL